MPLTQKTAEHNPHTTPRFWTGQFETGVSRRPFNPAVARALETQGMHPVAARVLAARCGADSADLVAPRLSSLAPPDTLPDINVAAERVADAIERHEIIGIVSDADVDGVSGNAVLQMALGSYFSHPDDKLVSFIGHRLKDGYGLSDGVAQRILALPTKPAVVITTDCGSSDEARIARLKAAGIDVIVTDHHELPSEGPPASALACVTPARADSGYPDRAIAGCMVAWLLMCQVRRALVTRGRLPAGAPNLSRLLDFVALGTVADCVSLATSANNRAVVRYGLELIGAGRRPAWKAARRFLGDADKPVTASDLAFQIGPRINARGRLDEAMTGVKFLLAKTPEEAGTWGLLLDNDNLARRRIEKELTVHALRSAERSVRDGAHGLAIWLENGHSGVQGIVASRLVERYGRPAVCLSPHAADAHVAVGSARSVDGLHIRDVLETINERCPGVIVKFGGHKAAGGLTVVRRHLVVFQRAFDEVCTERMREIVVGPMIMTDGDIEANAVNNDLMRALDALEPYGRGFERPVFECNFTVIDSQPMGDGTHLRLTLVSACGKHVFRAVWFRAINEAGMEPPVGAGQQGMFLFSPELNYFNGEANLQLHIKAMTLE